jgi:5-methylcytosine-specific restriction endonuclease McrA
MAKSRIPPALRAVVLERAEERCEYCHVPEESELTDYEIDHIIAEQHGGAMELENLAYACFEFNRYIGPNLTSIDPQNGEVVLLFNPHT